MKFCANNSFGSSDKVFSQHEKSPLETGSSSKVKERGNGVAQILSSRPTVGLFTTKNLVLFVLLDVICKSNAQRTENRWWWSNVDQLTNMARLILGDDPLLLSGKFEGDVLLSNEGSGNPDVAQEKNAVSNPSLLWPGGVIPYDFSPGYRVLPFERFLISRAMKDIESRSCVTFVERTDEYDYVRIIFDSYKCYSNVGRRGGQQILSLGIFCVMFYDRGNVYHELFHVLGFHHEHNRPDRDDHVDVKWDNIREGADINFEKRPYNSVDYLGLPYDIDSVMHYSPHAFSKVYYVLPTLVAHDRGIFFTRSRWPSKIDYAKLNRLYRCHIRRNSNRPPRLPPRLNKSKLINPFAQFFRNK